MVETAGRRIGRSDLTHGGCHEQSEHRTDDPADGDRPAAGRTEGDRVGADTAGQDADDRERDREILEPAHAAGKFLGITHAVEDFYVLIMMTWYCHDKTPSVYGLAQRHYPPLALR